MDSTQWAQGIGLLKKPLMEEGEDLVNSSFLSNNNNNNSTSSIRATLIIPDHHEEVVERRAIRSTSSLEKKKEKVHKYCPRCNSTNTKFCYYNNYSLTQPRYFCKTCRRYWTEGGSLRNVPVGGGSRKNKKHSSFPNLNHPSSFSSSSTKMSSNYQTFDHQVQDLNLSFLNNSNSNSNSGGPILAGMPMPMAPVVPDRDSSVMLFPFGEMKQHVGEPPMFWNYGMMGGGGGDGSW